MQNWSKRISWQPGEVLYPRSEAEIQQIILRAAGSGKNVRTIGTGHSFNPLWVTEDILISLDAYQGLVTVDPETGLVVVKAGTKLRQLGELLFAHGLAMENLGDIDAQSIAGTISTGTHGTGLDFGTISTQVRAIRLVNGRGEIVRCSAIENPELFRAAQVSLGSLGVITEITLQCVPAYKLELWSRKEELSAVLNSWQDRHRDNRNFEFYWFPYTQEAWTKTANLADEQPDKVGMANYLTEYFLENYVFQVLCEAATRFPGLNKSVARISSGSIPTVRKVYHSHKVYATQRLVRFNEMEYNIPLEAHEMVFGEIVRTITKRNYRIHFPIENRVVKGDRIPLSPAFGRDSAYIACHVYHKKEWEPFFRDMEAIFLAHGGRPHWGKIHFLEAEQLADRYPEFAAFRQLRAEQDPEGIFLNGYLRELLG
ncbi:D-arabinono-1,4-lactone oxidase [Flavilitoribacter nigricans]|uniref:FAD-binding oxidoreductase n=1 Tax=Flavilitoribacter nigricans (strain ATCC 23147 / DSM 23189 / NBRC 102662 / NCIMB 1420 / SS-2) TaxID=1122177 RepID=A0A2D0NA61_FLAN2|nr:D-arabinono-1,4-lactone oxidase [Flavilitoribacter nigricans]PHN05375.1 FAD-binding oxidoreductase [Flavilitoribacter nigricans DSM 23189 = NBRC 102662]